MVVQVLLQSAYKINIRAHAEPSATSKTEFSLK